MYVANLASKPFFVVNGENDRLYPAASVRPFVELFRRAGGRVLFRPQPESGHDLEWWPEEQARIDSFIATTPRKPLPDRIVWETELTDRYHRAHWVLITELGQVAGESEFDNFNTIRSPPTLFLGRAGAPKRPLREHDTHRDRTQHQTRHNHVDLSGSRIHSDSGLPAYETLRTD